MLFRSIEIDRQVRAFNPWPIAETRFEQSQLRILAARIEQGVGVPAATPGTMVAVREDAIVVQCGAGRLALTRVQRPGRRAVVARDFAGSRALLGQRLG